MRTGRLLGSVIILSTVFAFACGTKRNTGPSNGDGIDGGDSGGQQYCTDGSECRSGICQGGTCADAVGCTDHSDCNANEYCHFPSSWTPGTQGECSGPCAGSNDCDFAQECIDGRCYTNKDCDPEGNDCPPGEVCNRQTRVCTAPPEQCYFDDQCPTGWLCDTVTTFECYDPNSVGDPCVNDVDCDDDPGCGPGACECFDGGCQIKDGCDPTGDILAQCGAGNYCAGNVCRPATQCDDQATCTAYALLCDDPDGDGTSHCINPPPCNGTSCDDATLECRTNLNPPVCLPADDCECNRDDVCAADHYCELFTCSCMPGCRDDAGCFGDPACGGQPACYCQSDHTCGTTAPTNPGSACSGDTCAPGTMCVYNDPLGGLTCDIMPVGDCSQSCRVVCDLLLSQIFDPCPAGEQCGGSGGLGTQLITALFGSLMGDESNVSACYP